MPYIDQGRARAALTMLREARAIREELFAAGHWRIAETEGALNACLAALARFAEAEPLFSKSYETLAATFDAADPRTRRALADLIALYEAWDKPGQAGAYRARQADSAPG